MKKRFATIAEAILVTMGFPLFLGVTAIMFEEKFHQMLRAWLGY